MCAHPVWREWEDSDGSKTGILMYPEGMSERLALMEVGMEERAMEKTAERYFERDKTKVCEYRLSGRGLRA